MSGVALRRPDRGALLVTAAALPIAAAGVLVVVTHPSVAAMPLMLVALSLAVATCHEWLLRWQTLLAAIVLVILFVPMRRYTLPAALPINLEPYRLLVAGVAAAWVGSLLVQRDVRFRRTGLEFPLAVFGMAVLLGVLVNRQHISDLGVNEYVLKKCTFFLSFVLVMYFVVSVVRRRADVDALVKVLVAGGAFVACAAVVESRTGYNVFDQLGRLVPFLHFDASQLPIWTGTRGGRPRAYGSAQHAIALGAALAMLVPLAVYLGRRTGNVGWWVATGLLVLGATVTVSRTAMLMLVVEVLVLAWLQPATMRRLWPFALPLIVAMHIAAPGTLGAFKDAFFPEGGLIAEQSAGEGTYGSGRLADLGPGLREWSEKPLLGQGFGTRVTDQNDPLVNAPILDDEWLGTLLEVGAVGMLALLWLFVRAIRRLAAAARRDPTERSWLAAGLAASIYAFAVGMFTFDAFSFIQVTFLAFIALGIAAAELGAQRPVSVPIRRTSPRALAGQT